MHESFWMSPVAPDDKNWILHYNFPLSPGDSVCRHAKGGVLEVVISERAAHLCYHCLKDMVESHESQRILG